MAAGLAAIIMVLSLVGGGVAVMSGAGLLMSLAIGLLVGTLAGLCCVVGLLVAAMNRIHAIHLAELVSD